MLVKLRKDELVKYLDFGYNLALDFSKSSYPTYNDGIKTFDDFVESSLDAFNKDNEEILLFYYNNNLEGWIHYYYLEEDKYLGLSCFNINNYALEALNELLEYLNKYKGYECYLGCSINNEQTINALKVNGFKLIEDTIHNVLFFDNYELKEECINIKRIDKSNFNDFKLLHIVDEETYWNSDRLYEDIDRWNIYVYYENNEPKGAIYYIDVDLMIEIFGIDYLNHKFNELVMKELMIKTLNDGKRMGEKHLVFFSEIYEAKPLEELGFNNIDRYQCFYKVL